MPNISPPAASCSVYSWGEPLAAPAEDMSCCFITVSSPGLPKPSTTLSTYLLMPAPSPVVRVSVNAPITIATTVRKVRSLERIVLASAVPATSVTFMPALRPARCRRARRR